MSLLQWLQDSGFGQFIESSSWANLTLLCLHAIGMGIVVGTLWMLDLRVLGFPSTLPLSSFRPLLRLAWLGFGVNAASGILMFCGAATRFIINTDFQLKMLLILAGGASVWVLQRLLREHWQETGGVASVAALPRAAKLMAAASFVFWLGVILFGRQIAYTLARPSA